MVFARDKIVDHHKFQYECGLDQDTRGKLAKICTEKQYVEQSKLRVRVNTEFFGKPKMTVWRTTRIKLDLVVPLAYVAFWVSLAFWKKPWTLQFLF